MVIEILSKHGWGGLAYGLNFVGESLTMTPTVKDLSQRPWLVFEASASTVLYPPSLPRDFRQAMSCGRTFWIHSAEEQAPELALLLLESNLFEGILLRGLESFSRSAPAAIWGRRWQLAAAKSGTHLIWVHQKPQPVIGFDVRLEWTELGLFEIRKGHGFFEGKYIRGYTHESAA